MNAWSNISLARAMPHESLPNYLRMYRKRAGLSHRDVAVLLGVQSAAKISRYERFRREPTLQTAFAFSVIFAEPPTELFAGVYEDTRHRVLRRARLLRHRLELRQADPRLARKLAALQNLVAKQQEEARYEALP